MANLDTFGTRWGELRRQIKPHWMSLTEADVETIDGNADVLIDLLREKYGYSEAQAKEQVERFLAENETPSVPKPM